MNEHEQIMGIIAAKNQMPVALEPRSTTLIVVDMQGYFTQPSFPFTDVFEKLSPGCSAGYLKRVRETVIPSIQRLLDSFQREIRGGSYLVLRNGLKKAGASKIRALIFPLQMVSQVSSPAPQHPKLPTEKTREQGGL